MFGILNKKISFLKIWSGTPEIHCHVLPGIDDGSKNAETSLELLEKYKSLGCSRVIATPHTMSGMYDNTPESIQKAYNQVIVPENLNLTYSSEYMIDENFEKLLAAKDLIPLKDDYVLVEMSFFQPPGNLKEVLYTIFSKGYIPIIAHPERYAYYHGRDDILTEFKRMGCLFQLNALSLSKHYGDNVLKATMKLMSKDLYDFIGVDTHRMGHLEKIEKLEIPKKLESPLIKVCESTAEIFGT